MDSPWRSYNNGIELSTLKVLRTVIRRESAAEQRVASDADAERRAALALLPEGTAPSTTANSLARGSRTSALRLAESPLAAPAPWRERGGTRKTLAPSPGLQSSSVPGVGVLDRALYGAVTVTDVGGHVNAHPPLSPKSRPPPPPQAVALRSLAGTDSGASSASFVTAASRAVRRAAEGAAKMEAMAAQAAVRHTALSTAIEPSSARARTPTTPRDRRRHYAPARRAPEDGSAVAFDESGGESEHASASTHNCTPPLAHSVVSLFSIAGAGVPTRGDEAASSFHTSHTHGLRDAAGNGRFCVACWCNPTAPWTTGVGGGPGGLEVAGANALDNILAAALSSSASAGDGGQFDAHTSLEGVRLRFRDLGIRGAATRAVAAVCHGREAPTPAHTACAEPHPLVTLIRGALQRAERTAVGRASAAQRALDKDASFASIEDAIASHALTFSASALAPLTRSELEALTFESFSLRPKTLTVNASQRGSYGALRALEPPHALLGGDDGGASVYAPAADVEAALVSQTLCLRALSRIYESVTDVSARSSDSAEASSEREQSAHDKGCSTEESTRQECAQLPSPPITTIAPRSSDCSGKLSSSSLGAAALALLDLADEAAPSAHDAGSLPHARAAALLGHEPGASIIEDGSAVLLWRVDRSIFPLGRARAKIVVGAPSWPDVLSALPPLPPKTWTPIAPLLWDASIAAGHALRPCNGIADAAWVASFRPALEEELAKHGQGTTRIRDGGGGGGAIAREESRSLLTATGGELNDADFAQSLLDRLIATEAAGAPEMRGVNGHERESDVDATGAVLPSLHDFPSPPLPDVTLAKDARAAAAGVFFDAPLASEEAADSLSEVGGVFGNPSRVQALPPAALQYVSVPPAVLPSWPPDSEDDVDARFDRRVDTDSSDSDSVSGESASGCRDDESRAWDETGEWRSADATVLGSDTHSSVESRSVSETDDGADASNDDFADTSSSSGVDDDSRAWPAANAAALRRVDAPSEISVPRGVRLLLADIPCHDDGASDGRGKMSILRVLPSLFAELGAELAAGELCGVDAPRSLLKLVSCTAVAAEDLLDVQTAACAFCFLLVVAGALSPASTAPLWIAVSSVNDDSMPEILLPAPSLVDALFLFQRALLDSATDIASAVQTDADGGDSSSRSSIDDDDDSLVAVTESDPLPVISAEGVDASRLAFFFKNVAGAGGAARAAQWLFYALREHLRVRELEAPVAVQLPRRARPTPQRPFVPSRMHMTPASVFPAVASPWRETGPVFCEPPILVTTHVADAERDVGPLLVNASGHAGGAPARLYAVVIDAASFHHDELAVLSVDVDEADSREAAEAEAAARVEELLRVERAAASAQATNMSRRIAAAVGAEAWRNKMWRELAEARLQEQGGNGSALDRDWRVRGQKTDSHGDWERWVSLAQDIIDKRSTPGTGTPDSSGGSYPLQPETRVDRVWYFNRVSKTGSVDPPDGWPHAREAIAGTIEDAHVAAEFAVEAHAAAAVAYELDSAAQARAPQFYRAGTDEGRGDDAAHVDVSAKTLDADALAAITATFARALRGWVVELATRGVADAATLSGGPAASRRSASGIALASTHSLLSQLGDSEATRLYWYVGLCGTIAPWTLRAAAVGADAASRRAEQRTVPLVSSQFFDRDASIDGDGGYAADGSSHGRAPAALSLPRGVVLRFDDTDVAKLSSGFDGAHASQVARSTSLSSAAEAASRAAIARLVTGLKSRPQMSPASGDVPTEDPRALRSFAAAISGTSMRAAPVFDVWVAFRALDRDADGVVSLRDWSLAFGGENLSVFEQRSPHDCRPLPRVAEWQDTESHVTHASAWRLLATALYPRLRHTLLRTASASLRGGRADDAAEGVTTAASPSSSAAASSSIGATLRFFLSSSVRHELHDVCSEADAVRTLEETTGDALAGSPRPLRGWPAALSFDTRERTSLGYAATSALQTLVSPAARLALFRDVQGARRRLVESSAFPVSGEDARSGDTFTFADFIAWVVSGPSDRVDPDGAATCSMVMCTAPDARGAAERVAAWSERRAIDGSSSWTNVATGEAFNFKPVALDRAERDARALVVLQLDEVARAEELTLRLTLRGLVTRRRNLARLHATLSSKGRGASFLLLRAPSEEAVVVDLDALADAVAKRVELRLGIEQGPRARAGAAAVVAALITGNAAIDRDAASARSEGSVGKLQVPHASRTLASTGEPQAPSSTAALSSSSISRGQPQASVPTAPVVDGITDAAQEKSAYRAHAIVPVRAQACDVFDTGWWSLCIDAVGDDPPLVGGSRFSDVEPLSRADRLEASLSAVRRVSDPLSAPDEPSIAHARTIAYADAARRALARKDVDGLAALAAAQELGSDTPATGSIDDMWALAPVQEPANFFGDATRRPLVIAATYLSLGLEGCGGARPSAYDSHTPGARHAPESEPDESHRFGDADGREGSSEEESVNVAVRALLSARAAREERSEVSVMRARRYETRAVDDALVRALPPPAASIRVDASADSLGRAPRLPRHASTLSEILPLSECVSWDDAVNAGAERGAAFDAGETPSAAQALQRLLHAATTSQTVPPFASTLLPPVSISADGSERATRADVARVRRAALLGSRALREVLADGGSLGRPMVPHPATLGEAFLGAFDAARRNAAEELETILALGILDVGRATEPPRVAGEAYTGNTLLHVCAQTGARAAGAVVLRFGGIVNTQNARGNSALHFAMAFKATGLVDDLLAAGGDLTLLNAEGVTPCEGLHLEDAIDL